MSEIEFMTRQALLDRIHTTRPAFSALWEGLTPAQMTIRPGPQSDWSVKDLIAHMSWWEASAIARIDTLRNNEEFTPIADFDAVNAEVFEQHKDHDLANVLAEFDAMLPKLEAQIKGLTDAELNEVHQFDFGKLSFLLLYDYNTFGHYAEHTPDLENYVATLSTD